MDTTKHQRNVIGWILSNYETESAWNTIRKRGVTEEHFTDALCRSVFIAADAVKKTSKRLDSLSIIDHAVRSGMPLDGQQQAMRCVDEAVIIAGHLEPSIDALLSAHLADRAAMTLASYARAMKDTENAIDTLHEAQLKLGELSLSYAPADVHHISHFREEKLAQWEAARNTGFVGLPSSIQGVNKNLGGYRRKVMCMIGGYRGEGKSLFLRQELYSMARKGFKCLLVTLEDPEDIAAAIVAGHAAKRSIFALDTGTASDYARQDVDAAWAGMQDLPLWTAYTRTIEEIVSVCTAHKAMYGLDAIGLDHIQYISPYQLPKMDRNGTVAMYSNTVCGLLKDMDAAGLVASQFSRRAESEGRRPKLSDLRDSGTLEQDCRQALLLSRDGDDHLIEVAKNNFGPSGTDIRLRRIGAEHRFEEVQSVIERDMV
jgi:replicative DNA helicase